MRKGWGWVYDPHSGGKKIPEYNRELIIEQADKFSMTRPWYQEYEIKLRFRGQFCYLDGLKKSEKRAFPIGRLRYLRKDEWSLAFFTYSNETYQPCVFQDGKWEGTLEAGMLVCEAHLGD